MAKFTIRKPLTETDINFEYMLDAEGKHIRKFETKEDAEDTLRQFGVNESEIMNYFVIEAIED